MNAPDIANISEPGFTGGSNQYTSSGSSSKKYTETTHDSSFKPKASSISGMFKF